MHSHADEEGTHERLKAHLREPVDPKIKEHRGRIVKNTGDGLLVEFPSVVDAVRCAAEVQRGMGDRDAGMPDERRIKFRIGINLGDVIADGEDIFGDGVNVAARLEALAEPGGICISRVVRDQIRDKLPYSFEDMGEQSVKNIVRPVRVYALRPEDVAGLPTGSVSSSTSSSPPVAAPRLSIVVLPFTNLSDDREQQYQSPCCSLSDSMVFPMGKKTRPPITRFLRLLAWRSASRLRHLFCPISSAVNNPTRLSKVRRALSFFFFVPPIGDPSAKRSSCSCKTQDNDLRRKD